MHGGRNPGSCYGNRHDDAGIAFRSPIICIIMPKNTLNLLKEIVALQGKKH